MDKSRMIQQLLSATPALRTSIVIHSRTFRAANARRSYSNSIPGVTQPSFWVSLIPKPLRRGSRNSNATQKPKSKEWNPATFYIVIFLLIGSMSIQMIALRKESEAFVRQTDARIGLLKEVIERVRNGEDVDVEGLLGSNNKQKQSEWQQVLDEIQKDDDIWRERRANRSNEPSNAGKADSKSEWEAEEPTDAPTTQTTPKTPKTVKSNAPKGFY